MNVVSKVFEWCSIDALSKEAYFFYCKPSVAHQFLRRIQCQKLLISTIQRITTITPADIPPSRSMDFPLLPDFPLNKSNNSSMDFFCFTSLDLYFCFYEIDLSLDFPLLPDSLFHAIELCIYEQLRIGYKLAVSLLFEVSIDLYGLYKSSHWF